MLSRMRRLLLAAWFFLPPPALAAPRTVKVLFIGNSFTSVNELPRLFAAVAASKGVPVEAAMLANGGWGFSEHANSPETRKRLAAEPWDFVVLQDQSQRPSFERAQTEKEVFPYAAALAAQVRAERPEARIVFYETWGRRDGDASNCKGVPAVCTYEGMQERLSATYAELARRGGARLARVGEAWARVRKGHPSLDLYGGDGVHPSARGSYLAACVFYATIFRKPSAGATAAAGVTAEEAAILQTAADRRF